MGFFSSEKRKRTPMQVQARLKKRLEKKKKLAKAKADNAKLRADLAKLS
jgi:hypothetical protein